MKSRDHSTVLRVAALALHASVLARVGVAQSPFEGPDKMLGMGVQDVAVLDLDGDHDDDVAVSGFPFTAPPFVGTVQFWINDKNGLTAGPSFTTAYGLSTLSHLDLDLDGDEDLFRLASPFAPETVGELAALLSDGSGGITASITQSLAGTPTGPPRFADLDADGLPDLAVTLKAGIAILRNTGGGSFTTPSTVIAGPQPTTAVLADLQNDGDPDLVVLNGAAGQLTCLPGAAGTGFGSQTTTALGGSATALIVESFDGDEVPDALVAHAASATMTLLRGDGSGGWLAPELLPGSKGITSFQGADVDLDGDVDVVASGSGLGTNPTEGVLVFRCQGDGTFADPGGTVAEHSVIGVDVGDLNGDNLPDIVAVKFESALSVRRGDGLGNFPDAYRVEGGWCGRGDLGDVDGDGLLDIVMGDYGNDIANLDAKIFKGDGECHLTAPVSVGYEVTHFPKATMLEDFTGDGHQDILLADGKLVLLAADGAGGFLPPTYTQGVIAGWPMRIMDLDGDADADVITTNVTFDGVNVTRNVNGLLPAAVLTQTPEPGAMALGHIDADGNPDAVVTHGTGDNLTILRGDGAAGWLPATSAPGEAGASTIEMLLADVDGDGFDDAVTASFFGSGAGRFSIRFADGIGGLSGPVATNLAAQPQDFALGDLDLDGFIDAAIGSDHILILRGDGNGGFVAGPQYLGELSHSMILIGDLDSNGAPDLVSYNGLEQTLWVLRNTSLDVAPWKQLGFALDGDSVPRLAGAGTLVPGSPGHVTLVHALPSTLAALFVSATSSPAAFKGGTLVPVPPAVMDLFVVPPTGQLQMSWTAWPALPAGASFYLQMALADGAAPANVALTNALNGTVP